MVETAVTVTSQSKLRLCTMLHSFVPTNKSPSFTFLLFDPPLNEFRNLFFTIKVHHSHHRYHYKHSNIGNQHCTYFTLWYNHIYCTFCHCWSYRVPHILKLVWEYTKAGSVPLMQCTQRGSHYIYPCNWCDEQQLPSDKEKPASVCFLLKALFGKSTFCVLVWN